MKFKKRKILVFAIAFPLLLVVVFLIYRAKYSADTVGDQDLPIIEQELGMAWGKISDINDMALPDITISIGQTTATTDSNGEYEIDGAELGFNEVTIAKELSEYVWDDNGAIKNYMEIQRGGAAATDITAIPVDLLNSDEAVVAFLFDEISTPKTADSSGFGNHATTNDTSIAEGRPNSAGKARYFNGTSAFASVPDNNSLKPEEEITLSTWVRLASTDEYSRIIDKSLYAGPDKGGYSLMIGGSSDDTRNKAIFSLYSSSGQERKCVSATGLPRAGAWFHLAATYNGTNSKIYIDGAEVCNQAFDTDETIKHVNNPLNLGRYSGVARHYMKGTLDEVRIYDKALTPEEIGVLVSGE